MMKVTIGRLLLLVSIKMILEARVHFIAKRQIRIQIPGICFQREKDFMWRHLAR